MVKASIFICRSRICGLSWRSEAAGNDWLTLVWMYMCFMWMMMSYVSSAMLHCCGFDCVWSWEVCCGPWRNIDLVGGYEIEHKTLKYISSWSRASVFVWVWHVCRGVGIKKKKQRKKEGLGWAFFLASLSSLEVECLSPPSPLFELLALGQVTKKRIVSQDGETQSGPACLHMSVHVNVCVCEALTRTCHISYTFFVLGMFACLLHPSKHTLPLHSLQTTSCDTHPKPLYVWSVFLEPLLCQQPTFCALAVGESDLNSSPLCLPLDTVDNCRL